MNRKITNQMVYKLANSKSPTMGHLLRRKRL